MGRGRRPGGPQEAGPLTGQDLLVIGYGNPARGDDGLAPAFVERIRSLQLPGVDARLEYQLCVEYAPELGAFGRVVFVDASLEAREPFTFTPLGTDAERYLDTHTLSPGALMFLARTLYGAETAAFLLAIRGYRFEPFTEGLSPGAERNLCRAVDFFAAAGVPPGSRRSTPGTGDPDR